MGSDFELVEREMPAPEPTAVRVAGDACDICHDAFVKEESHPGGSSPGLQATEPPGASMPSATVSNWEPGGFAGGGWHGDHRFECESIPPG